ncbi:FAD/NAD(P)-binding protein [Caulobacter segnis]|uniref:FAD/NAD(P)-binding protein n=1 Tax=Caulobacter segnis TaxID=88688 RepID=UPI00240FAF87|nr:FAD/NAD(P)-binding protein [Caulobacter segnis]MDG2522110.1 FAD/NAD(P)-binding protein [Caulobacter segnis]
MHIAIVGDGFSGTLFALKIAAAKPQARVTVIGRERRLGRGLAYGAADPMHMLNVPVSRMDLGLQPSFHDWLRAEHGDHWTLEDFAPRALFGDYMEALAATATTTERIHRVRGEAVGMDNGLRSSVLLADGRTVAADVVVLALGNLPPDRPGGMPEIVLDSDLFVSDPWAAGALDGLPSEAPVLLIGAGLTMIDIALRLAGRRHRGTMTAVSRRGLLPRGHVAGGIWPAFLHELVGHSPRTIARELRRQVRLAQVAGTPWQRVFDAARPAVPAVWSAWSLAERRRFLKRLRPWWDVHRHRTAPEVTANLQALLDGGRLEVLGGRFGDVSIMDGVAKIQVAVDGVTRTVDASRVINCTGPGGRFDRTAIPLIADLRAKGLARADALGLGLDTQGGAVVGVSGDPSERLFALGPLAKAAWWEITAVPEITIQIDDLVRRLANEATPASPLSATAFMDMGAGI